MSATPSHDRAGADAAAQASAAARRQTDALREAVGRLLGAERRLRGRDHSRSGELTHAQLRSITALGREREMTAGQLAKSADLNPASVTAMLDHLEAAEIVQRERSSDDRRVCKVSLTPKGWELFERKLAAWQSLWEDRLSDLSDDELEVATAVIERVAAIFDSLATRPARGAE
jgi:DNA-binding MarR family transcriptional regulator